MAWMLVGPPSMPSSSTRRSAPDSCEIDRRAARSGTADIRTAEQGRGGHRTATGGTALEADGRREVAGHRPSLCGAVVVEVCQAVVPVAMTAQGEIDAGDVRDREIATARGIVEATASQSGAGKAATETGRIVGEKADGDGATASREEQNGLTGGAQDGPKTIAARALAVPRIPAVVADECGVEACDPTAVRRTETRSLRSAGETRRWRSPSLKHQRASALMKAKAALPRRSKSRKLLRALPQLSARANETSLKPRWPKP
mmetsp:Transcript_35058/g.80725  ORF Transcript_35058/g.80725 Transcript_35058/m.80725 type:complete len:260 (-) Transcript_35058:1152-1931(-)